MPASTRARTPPGTEVAGPRVQTIFARRMISMLFADPVVTSPGSWPVSHAERPVRGVHRTGKLGDPVLEVCVHTGGSRAALGDGPHDQRLAATGISGDEDTGHRCHEGLVPLDVRALVQLNAELFDHTLGLRSEEAHR